MHSLNFMVYVPVPETKTKLQARRSSLKSLSWSLKAYISRECLQFCSFEKRLEKHKWPW